MNQISTFQVATQVTFGPGALSRVTQVVPALGARRMLVVTDAGLVAHGIVARLIDVLRTIDGEAVVFDAVEPNPSLETVARAHVRYQETACQGIVALGGGSPLDVAKAVGVLASNPGTLESYIGMGKVKNRLPPLLAIPTTVGTGSEVTTFSVITDREQRKKVVVGSPLLPPSHAFLDPELVLSLPAHIVAATGIDALTHAVESVISVFAGPFTDGLALEAIRMIAANLPAAVSSSAMEPRANLLYASSIAGMAFSYARTGLVHGMAHPLGGYHDVPHGLANAVLLPHVLAFNAPACQDQLARVALAMGEAATAQAAIDAVRRLNAEVGIPTGLGQVGVTDAFIPAMAQDAYQSANAQVVNPRKPSLLEVIELYQQAL